MQPLLVSGAVTAQASSAEVGAAAYTMFKACVVEQGVGGVASDIGASVLSQTCLLSCISLWEIHRLFLGYL